MIYPEKHCMLCIIYTSGAQKRNYQNVPRTCWGDQSKLRNKARAGGALDLREICGDNYEKNSTYTSK
jgi:hypothetical protein